MDFDFKDLEIIMHLVKEKSFTKAAEKVFLAQASVSERISNLEDRLGLRLVDRLPKGAELTKAGRVFYDYAQKILDIRAELINEIRALLGLKSGKLLVGASTVPGEYILPSIISKFITDYPSIVIDLVISDSANIITNVLNGNLELGVVGTKDNHSDLEFIPVWYDEVVVATYKGHKFYERHEITLKELLGERIILREKGSGTLSIFERRIRELGLIPGKDLKVFARLGSTTAVKEAVKSGLGISMISERAIMNEIERGELRPLRIQGIALERYFHLTFHKMRALSPIATEFKRFLIEMRDESGVEAMHSTSPIV